MTCILRKWWSAVVLVVLAAQSMAAEPPWPSVRPGGKLPPIKKPVLFNTPEADRILEAMQIFPPDNA
ncbi:MAG: hypothetical protein K8R36_12215 [Planctomycetales bacterium]|nr:hypothetical protein [Planctomycetales bacterium]